MCASMVFGGRARRNVAVSLGLPAGRGQGACGRSCRSDVSGSASSNTKCGRHHVVGQRCTADASRNASSGAACGMRRPDRPPAACRPGMSSRASTTASRTAGCARQRRLDFAQLDAEAADLHLMVDAAEILDVAVRQIARQVAALVHARARRAEGIGDKLARPSARAGSDSRAPARAADVQLARHARPAPARCPHRADKSACWRSAGRSAPVMRVAVTHATR